MSSQLDGRRAVDDSFLEDCGLADPFLEKEYVEMPSASSLNTIAVLSRQPNGAPAIPAAEGYTQATMGALARSAGFTEAGIAGLPHPEASRDAQRFTRFIDEGHSGEMHYLARRNEQGEFVRSNIHVPFPWARSVVVCLAGYNAAAPLSTEPAAPESGWIARYAWSGHRDEQGRTRPSDYHKALLKRLRVLEAEMRSAFGDFESRAYVDTGPIVERAAAQAAGLGWTGKNTCLIHPRFGSWNFLAVIVTSLPLAEEHAPLVVPDRCGSCTRCLEACPTQALIEPYRMDATRCISYLTIEHRGEIAEELRSGIGRQVFGCDICQDVCPWNRKAPIGPGMAAEGHSDLAPRPALVNPSLEWLANLELADFERLFNGSPVRRAGFAGLCRNIAIAMGNSGLKRFLPRLEEWAHTGSASGTDTEPAPLQSAARWAIRQITQNHALR
jgi:epoxyqueuosine reductase